MTIKTPRPSDVLFLFACRVECLQQWNEEAFVTLVEAMSDPDPDVRIVASNFVNELATSTFAPRARGQMHLNAGKSL